MANPAGAPYPISLRTWTWSSNTLSAPAAVVFPFSLSDWSVPSRVSPAIALKTWIDPLKLNLASQDKFFGLAGSPNFDWPVPKGYIPDNSLKTWTDPVKLNLLDKDQFFGLGGNPNFDWPVPKSPTPAISLRTWIDPLKILAGQDKFFGLAGNPTFDWPVPKGHIPASILRTWIDPLKLNLLNKDQFFGAAGQVPNYDWQNPRGAAFPSDLRSFLAELKLNLLSQDQFFGAAGQPPANLDWPVPRTRLSNDLKTWIYPNLFGTTLVNPPFSMLDWQNPRGAIPAITLRTWADLLKLNLLSQDQFFGAAGQPPANLDWPVPKGKMYSIMFRVWLLNLLESTLAPVVPPVGHCRLDASGRQVSSVRQTREDGLDASGRADVICP